MSYLPYQFYYVDAPGFQPSEEIYEARLVFPYDFSTYWLNHDEIQHWHLKMDLIEMGFDDRMFFQEHYEHFFGSHRCLVIEGLTKSELLMIKLTWDLKSHQQFLDQHTKKVRTQHRAVSEFVDSMLARTTARV